MKPFTFSIFLLLNQIIFLTDKKDNFRSNDGEKKKPEKKDIFNILTYHKNNKNKTTDKNFLLKNNHEISDKDSEQYNPLLKNNNQTSTREERIHTLTMEKEFVLNTKSEIHQKDLNGLKEEVASKINIFLHECYASINSILITLIINHFISSFKKISKEALKEYMENNIPKNNDFLGILNAFIENQENSSEIINKDNIEKIRWLLKTFYGHKNVNEIENLHKFSNKIYGNFHTTNHSKIKEQLHHTLKHIKDEFFLENNVNKASPIITKKIEQLKLLIGEKLFCDLYFTYLTENNKYLENTTENNDIPKFIQSKYCYVHDPKIIILIMILNNKLEIPEEIKKLLENGFFEELDKNIREKIILWRGNATLQINKIFKIYRYKVEEKSKITRLDATYIPYDKKGELITNYTLKIKI